MKFKKTRIVAEEGSVMKMKNIREVQLSYIQMKLFRTIMDAVKSDPALVEFCSSPAVGKSYVLNLVDMQFDEWVENTLQIYFNNHPLASEIPTNNEG